VLSVILTCVNTNVRSPTLISAYDSNWHSIDEDPILPITSVVIEKTTCPPTQTCDNQPWGTMFPYPPNCTQYIYCHQNGTAELSFCPTDQPHFSPTELICMTIELANCTACDVAPSCPPTPTCGPNDVGARKSYPPDCTKYIYCDQVGSQTISSCPASEHFSTTAQICTAPDEANCTYCIVTEDQCPPTPTCNVSDIGIMKPYPPDCSKYIYCNENAESELTFCPQGTNFSPTKYVCMDPVLANCTICAISISNIRQGNDMKKILFRD
jgi:hypothetical protein